MGGLHRLSFRLAGIQGSSQSLVLFSYSLAHLILHYDLLAKSADVIEQRDNTISPILKSSLHNSIRIPEDICMPVAITIVAGSKRSIECSFVGSETKDCCQIAEPNHRWPSHVGQVLTNLSFIEIGRAHV